MTDYAAEAFVACEIAGSCLERTDEVNDLGLWDSSLCDPKTARSGGVDFPIGPWARGKAVGRKTGPLRLLIRFACR